MTGAVRQVGQEKILKVTLVQSHRDDLLLAQHFLYCIQKILNENGFQGCKIAEVIGFSHELDLSPFKGQRVLKIDRLMITPDIRDQNLNILKECKRVGAFFLLHVDRRSLGYAGYQEFEGKYTVDGEVNDAVRQWITQPITPPVPQAPIQTPSVPFWKHIQPIYVLAAVAIIAGIFAAKRGYFTNLFSSKYSLN